MNETSVYLELPCAVTATELVEHAEKLSRQVATVESIQLAKKQSASEFKAMEEKATADVKKTATIISTRTEYREVECHVEFDYARGVVNTYRCDTHDLVETRRMKEFERQGKLPINDEE